MSDTPLTPQEQAFIDRLLNNDPALTINGIKDWSSPNCITSLIQGLKVNTTLTTLGFAINNFGPQGVQFLGEAFRSSRTSLINNTLTTLNLCSNNLGPQGAQFLGEALKVNTTLTFLNLTDNNFGFEGAQFLGEALKN
jgi:hypothetical protein